MTSCSPWFRFVTVQDIAAFDVFCTYPDDNRPPWQCGGRASPVNASVSLDTDVATTPGGEALAVARRPPRASASMQRHGEAAIAYCGVLHA